MTPEELDKIKNKKRDATEVDRFAGSGDVYQGGFILYRRENGEHFIEATQGIAEDDDNQPPWLLLRVYRHDVPDDVWAEFDWAEKDAVVSFVDGDVNDGTSEDPMTRAHVMENIASYHGWENLNHDPLVISLHELKKRWDDKDDDDDAVEAVDQALSGADWGADEVGFLYNLLVKAEAAKWNLEAMLLEAMRLRRRAKKSLYAQREGDAITVANNAVKGLDFADQSWLHGYRVVVYGPRMDAATVTYDTKNNRWVAKYNDDPAEPEIH